MNTPSSGCQTNGTARGWGTILAVQDTTSLNYNTQTKMEGIGSVCEQALGVNIHSCLAVTVDGLALGVLAQSSYNRAYPSDNARTHESKKVRLLEEKESYRWVQTLGKIAEAVPGGIHIVTVCDREGDMADYSPTNCLTRRTASGRRF